jgi:hypothetical protein
MTKFITSLALCVLTLAVKAQQVTPLDQEYGKVNQADLEMKSCDFEKDANAEVLISRGDLYYDQTFNVILEVHRRIKIFNDNGKSYADIVIPFDGGDRSEFITGLQAETINLVDGKVEVTKLDKKQIYIKSIDKIRSEMIFTFPNVKSGSIIDYKYTWNGEDYGYVPAWIYQEEIPARYNELDTKLPDLLYFNTRTKSLLRLTKYSTSQDNGSIGVGPDAINYTNECAKREMDNIPSLKDEPYMSSKTDNQASISFILTSIRPTTGFVKSRADTWAKIGGALNDDEDFGHQVKRKLAGEDVIVNQAKALKTDDEKIAFLFNKVKTTMKWDGEDRWYTNVGTSSAWDTKTGNSAEINLILCHLLKKAGVAAMPMVVSTRNHGKVYPAFPYAGQFNRAVVYIYVDSTKQYVLDAANKYNMYNEIPYNILNSSGFYIDMDKKEQNMVFLQKRAPIRESIFITAEIKPDGKIEGDAEISSLSYNRMSDIDDYTTNGEKKYIDKLKEDDNNLKIASLKMENMEVDSLPLVQSIKFNLDLTGSDDNYIYFNSNLFSSLHKNPFLSETRSSDIDFGYPSSVVINGIYKEPAGYKVDAMPKNISMTMPDKGISFKRIIGEQDGNIVVRYVVTYNKSIFFKEDYADFHEFFKQLFQMLNEPIALKKS